MKKMRTGCFLLAFVFCLAGVGLSNAQAQNYNLKIQTAVPSSSIYFKLIERMAGRVDAMSAGRLKVEVLPAGTVVGAFEILDAVNKNIINGGFAWTHYWSGKHPAGLLFSAPTAGLGVCLDQTSVMSWIYDGGGDELYQKYFTEILKFKVKGFLCMPMGPEPYGWFSKPVNSVEDLKKMKFRSPPGIPAESFKVIVIPTVSMPGGAIVPSAQRGVIEHNAVAEARKLKVPVVAIVDTNCDPDEVDYPVAGNDDAIRSVRMILATLGQVITQAQAEYESRSARRKPAEEVTTVEPAGTVADPIATATAPVAVEAPPSPA